MTRRWHKPTSRAFERSAERQGCPKLILIHRCKIIPGVYVPCPAEEELVERFHGTGTHGIIDASEGDLGKERLRAWNGNKLEVIWKYPRPVRNKVVPCEGHISVTARDHLRKIAMHDAKATRETHLGRDKSISGGLSKQLLCGSKTLRTNIARIRQRDPRTCTYYVSQAVNATRVAFAKKQRDTAILAKEPRLRLDDAQLMQMPQGLRVAHEDIRIEAGGAAYVEREIAEGNSSSAYHLYEDRLRQGDQNDIG